MRRPTVTTGPGNAHAAPGERIVEISFPAPGAPGCLVSLRVSDGRPVIEIFRSDPGIIVIAPAPPDADPAELGEHRCDPLCPGWFIDAETARPARCDDCWRHAPETFDDAAAARRFAAVRLPFADARLRAVLDRVAAAAPVARVLREDLMLRGWITEAPHQVTQAGREARMLGATNDCDDPIPEEP